MQWYLAEDVEVTAAPAEMNRGFHFAADERKETLRAGDVLAGAEVQPNGDGTANVYVFGKSALRPRKLFRVPMAALVSKA